MNKKIIWSGNSKDLSTFEARAKACFPDLYFCDFFIKQNCIIIEGDNISLRLAPGMYLAPNETNAKERFHHGK